MNDINKAELNSYDITITETLKRTYTIEAESREAAEQTVSKRWHDGEYVLNADDFKEVDIITDKEHGKSFRADDFER